jgi:hypothetical protein
MLEMNIYTSPYLIVDSEIELSTPIAKGKGWDGKGLLMVGHN